MKMIFRHKIIYGRDAYYPECELSLKICELLKQKTLTMSQLKQLEDIGFIIKVFTYDAYESGQYQNA